MSMEDEAQAIPDDGSSAPHDLDADLAAGGTRQLLAARRERLNALRAAGEDPFPVRSQRNHATADAILSFETLEQADSEHEEGPTDVVVTGRLVGAVRDMGGSVFVHLADASGRLQLHLRRARMGREDHDRFKATIDAGDIVEARGAMFRTRKGEVSLAVDKVRILAKSLRPLPNKVGGLADTETRLRQRYLDLMVNEETRARFAARSRIVSAMRRYLDERGFLEVETPTMQPLYGGGAARPFTTHYHALDQTMYLRIADELYLKRLLVGGFEKVYEICKDFRNEGIDRTHLPEFTMMECYWAYADYRDMMRLTEHMVAEVAEKALGTLTVEYEGHAIDLSPPWRRLTVRDAILQSTKIDIGEAETLEALRAEIRRLGLAVATQPTWAKTVDALIGEYVEPAIVQPTFLMDHPVALSPLAKRKPDDPRYAERFEPLVAGFELGNAFSELNDPDEQRARFEEMGLQREAGDDEAHPLDEDFLEALAHGMPPTGGLGIGIDRLVMLLTGTPNIREVVLFPQLRVVQDPASSDDGEAADVDS